MLAAARAVRKVRAAALFEEDPPGGCVDDVERFLTVEYGLPSHAKRASLGGHGGHGEALGGEDIFEELFHLLPNGPGHESEITGKPFADFGAPAELL